MSDDQAPFRVIGVASVPQHRAPEAPGGAGRAWDAAAPPPPDEPAPTAPAAQAPAAPAALAPAAPAAQAPALPAAQATPVVQAPAVHATADETPTVRTTPTDQGPTDRTPVSLSVPSRRGHIGRVSIGQVVAAQVAVVAAVATYPLPDQVFIPVLLLGVVLLAMVFTPRSGGRWWYVDALLRLQLRQRASRHQRTRQRRRSRPRPRSRAGTAIDAPATAGTGSSLPALAGDVAVREISDRGTRVGVGTDDHGFYSALELTLAATAPPDRLALGTLLQTLSGIEAPVSTLQVVHHAVPLPTVSSAAGERVWVALRLERADAPEEAASRGGGLEGVHRALAAAIGRITKTLRAHDVDCQPLTADQLREAIGAVAGVSTAPENRARPDAADGGDPTAGQEAGGMPAVRELWTSWDTADASHLCFRVHGTLALGDLLAGLRATSALSYTLAVRFPVTRVGDEAGEPPRHGLLRVMSGAGMIDSTVAEVAAVADRLGCRLRRLDGQHGPAVYASAPTGATVR